MKLLCALIVCVICVGAVNTALVKRQTSDTLIAKYPFIVAVMYNDNFAGNGVIVSGKWILSTATVFANAPDNAYRVLAGSSNYLEGSTANSVQRIIKHPQYDAQNGPGNNIALAQTDQFLPETNIQQAVNLGINDVPSAFTTMATFGGTQFLQEQQFNLASDDACISQLSDQANQKIVADGLAYCVSLESGYVLGPGDLGAPMMSMNFLYALYADGHVATRIAIYRNWILSTMHDNP